MMRRTSEDVAGNAVPAEEDYPGSLNSELDIFSETFDPLRALYAPDYRICRTKPKVIYQTLAAFESAFKRFGILNLNKRNNTDVKKDARKKDVSAFSSAKSVSSKEFTVKAEEAQQRRFQAPQMPGKGSGRKQKDTHNIFTFVDGFTGPLVVLKQSKKQRHLRVMMRHELGIRGGKEGVLSMFDKVWNLWLRHVLKVYQQRKYKYAKIKCVENHRIGRRGWWTLVLYCFNK